MNQESIPSIELKALVENNPQPSAIFLLADDEEFVCFYFNQGFVNAIGRDQSLIESATIFDLFSSDAPEIVRRMQETIQFRRFIQSRCVLNGCVYPFSVTPFFRDGQVVSLHLSLFTDLRRTESIINPQTLLDSLLDVVFVFDVGNDGKFRLSYLNRSYEESTGILLSEYRGKTPVDSS